MRILSKSKSEYKTDLLFLFLVNRLFTFAVIILIIVPVISIKLKRIHMQQRNLYLLDAFALIYRSFFAFGKTPLVNSKGMNVSAISGFISTILDLVKNEPITHLAIAFDHREGSWRDKVFEEYKAHREAMPEDLRQSLPYIRDIIAGMNIPLLEVAGYEADDIIGTLAKRAAQDGFSVYMVTSDKDYGQLVSDNIFIYKPPYLKNPKEIMGVPEVLRKWDIENIDQVVDMLGLMGDSSDNIPGIKGVGEKTAQALLKQFGSIENLLDNIDQLQGKVREKVEAGKDSAILSKQLATISCDVPIVYQPEEYALSPVNREILAPIFAELEFRTLAKRMFGESSSVSAPLPSPTAVVDLFSSSLPDGETQQVVSLKLRTIADVSHDYRIAATAEQQEELVRQLLEQKEVCFDTETTHLDTQLARLVGMSFSYHPSEAWYVPVPAEPDEAEAVVNRFIPFFEAENVAKIGQNIKYDLSVLANYDIVLKGVLEDTMIAHYLLEPELRHNMDYLSETYLAYQPISIETLIGKKGKKQLNMRQAPVEQVAVYAAEDADITLQLYRLFNPKIAENPALRQLYSDVEMPLVRVLSAMEREGVRIDTPFLAQYSEELGKEITQIKQTIYDLAGVSFNLDSPQQLGNVLFGQLKIPADKKTATGQYATGEEVLQTLVDKHPIIAPILNYRELSKLKSTYVDALPVLVNPQTERLHSSFNQTVAATGRLSSTNPNLQNIPIRTERGKEIRKAFIPRNEDYIILSADYSQIELRLMAAFSQDEAMLQAFREGYDIHRATAARVYGVPFDAVTGDMRRAAKMVNFGIIYGISAFGLSQRLGVNRTEAKNIIDEYFKQYPGIKAYMDKSVSDAREKGYAETILGRRRYLKDIHSANRTVRQFAERNAINTPIQGSAADLIKLAMIAIHKDIQQKELRSRMVLQVHDELVFDVYRPEKEEMSQLVKYHMENALPSLAVPIEAETGTGDNWLAAH